MVASHTESTVVIARGDLTPALRQRLSFDPAVLVFSAAEYGHAMTAIMQRHLPMIALDRQFATSPDGTRFVADLRNVHPEPEIRILSDQGSEIPLLLRRPALATGRATVASLSQRLTGDIRKAPRYPVHAGCEALVNGEPTSLVNVSVTGAQLVSPVILKPAQHVRIAIPDEEDAIRLRAAVAWSIFERSKKTGETCYRAGLEFSDAVPRLIEKYCQKHGIQL